MLRKLVLLSVSCPFLVLRMKYKIHRKQSIINSSTKLFTVLTQNIYWYP